MHNSDWNRYFYELQQHIQNQDERIKSLEEQVQHLISSQEGKNGVTIERVEYKFDQLKIETLSGSLHIGLSPEDLNPIEDLALGQANQPPPYPNTPTMDQHILNELNQWCQSFVPHMIDDLANTYNRNIDESHQTVMIQDIQKQFPHRIAHYHKLAEEQSMTNEHELKAYIIDHIQNEVHQSLTKYMKNDKGE